MTPLPSPRPWPSIALLAALGFGTTACGGGGGYELGWTREGGVPIEPAPVVEPDEPLGSSAAGFVGRWRGQVGEPLALGVDPAPDASFRSGSTPIELVLVARADTNAEGSIGGWITFGTGAPPPPATDGSSGYPVGLDYGAYMSVASVAGGIGLSDGGTLPPLEGFEYVLDSSSAEDGSADGALRVAYDPASYLGTWCGLQAPHPHPDGSYRALPYAAGGVEVMADGTNRPCSGFGPADLSACPEGMEALPPDEYLGTYLSCFRQGPVLYRMSCDRVFLSQFCSCNPGICHEGKPRGRTRLMLRADGDALIGSFENATFLGAHGPSARLGDVRFERVDD